MFLGIVWPGKRRLPKREKALNSGFFYFKIRLINKKSKYQIKKKTKITDK